MSYAGMPLSTVVETDWKHLGPVKFLFAGTLASVIFRHLHGIGPQAIRAIYNRLTRRFVWRILEPRRKQYIRRILDVTEIM